MYAEVEIAIRRNTAMAREFSDFLFMFVFRDAFCDMTVERSSPHISHSSRAATKDSAHKWTAEARRAQRRNRQKEDRKIIDRKILFPIPRRTEGRRTRGGGPVQRFSAASRNR